MTFINSFFSFSSQVAFIFRFVFPLPLDLFLSYLFIPILPLSSFHIAQFDRFHFIIYNYCLICSIFILVLFISLSTTTKSSSGLGTSTCFIPCLFRISLTNLYLYVAFYTFLTYYCINNKKEINYIYLPSTYLSISSSTCFIPITVV